MQSFGSMRPRNPLITEAAIGLGAILHLSDGPCALFFGPLQSNSVFPLITQLIHGFGVLSFERYILPIFSLLTSLLNDSISWFSLVHISVKLSMEMRP